MTVLIDTSLLLAYAFAKDINHAAASQAMHSLTQERRIVPAPVLTELFYMTMVRIHYKRAIEVFAITRKAFTIEPLTAMDLAHMEAIMEQYQDAEFDFTDTAIMALAERLNISRIGTFDRRDFSIYRPTRFDYLELFP